MNWNHSFGPFGENSRQSFLIKVLRDGVDVCDNRRCPAADHSRGCCYKGSGRHNNFIAGSNLQSGYRQFQRSRTVGNR